MWESERPEKFSLLLIVIGFIIGIIGAAVTFAWSAGFAALFYLGFFIAIIGFAFAVYSKLTEKK
ncbi:MAG: hypothetical protein MUP55_00845 [Candidatus Aenigmarchaeota archaeon]|nr:hypothetical protein [Candidatus Aenigmarchaeota archaeon]